MGDLLVFIPAWNEAESLAGVLDELAQALPEADVLVVDDGSTDATAEIARSHGAEVLSFGQNRGLRAGIAAGYAHAARHGYAICGRLDGDGQHPPAELARLVREVREGRCDVAVGSRFASNDDYRPYRYRLDGARRLGTAFMRRAMRLALGRAFRDPMSGMYAVGAAAIPLLARPYTSEAPEVEALMRIGTAGLRLEEVPVEMRSRSAGESKLQGRKAVVVVATVAATLWMGRRMLLRRSTLRPWRLPRGRS
jgi:glycosyltransferase involved in cell wall biosynthesis